MKNVLFFSKYPPFGFSLLFILLLVSYFVTGSDYLFFILVFLLISASSFLLSFVSSKWLLMALAFSIPFSIQTDIGATGINIFFPSELLEGVFAGAVLIKIINWKFFDSKFFFHPVTLLVLGYFFLTVATGIFSEMPVISFKAILVKGVYFLVFYFLAFDAVKNNHEKSMLKFITCYTVALLPVILYTLYSQAVAGFDKDLVNFPGLPFFKDHTIYSACIAFVIPILAYNVWRSKKSVFEFIFSAAILFLFGAGLFYSFSRAAWVSIFAAFVFFIILLLKIRPFVLVMLSVLFAVVLFQKSEYLLSGLRQNKNDSTIKNVDLEVQAKSITNISTDQSNAERLNRWKCALRMFDKKPLTGFGSGTYMFRYFDFQRKADMTYISVASPYNAKAGHGGSVHSEYLLVLAENGIFTFIVFMILVLKIIFMGIKNTYYHSDKNKRMEAAVLTLALITYLVHGFFNNFLDTDKAAFPFWSSTAMLVMIDLSGSSKA